MKILKSILAAVAVIITIALAGIYFLPDQYNISNSIEISKPANVVYAQVSNFNQWKAWSPYQEMEPDAINVIHGVSAQAGHKMTWNGKVLGEGSMTISSAVPGKNIYSDLDFIKPYKFTAKDYWEFEQKGDNIKVTWGTKGGLAYPFGRLAGLKLDAELNKTQKQGLDKLKKLCEAMPDGQQAEITTVVIK
jgi:hypothetical protein